MENKRTVYLDNAATTKPCDEAVKAMLMAAEVYGNPSSLHGLGLESEKLINKAKESISSKLGVDKNDIYFTSGGTEANNTAIFGTAYAREKIGKRVITTSIEHPSVLESFKKLENDGFDVKYLSVNNEGIISLEELGGLLTEDTTLVSIMHVNNETGVIEPVDKIKSLIKEKSPKAIFHTDCVQSFGKLPVEPKKWGADMVSISAHKIHGFKGTGALYISHGTNIKSLIYGGEQQKGIRPGTENVGGILAFGAAVKCCGFDEDKLLKNRSRFINRLTGEIDNIVINGAQNNSGSVLNVSFMGIKAEILLHSLEAKGIYVSTGSACSSHKPSPSHVLTAMGKSKQEIEGAIRFSFAEGLSDDDMEYTISILKKEVETIRRYMR